MPGGNFGSFFYEIDNSPTADCNFIMKRFWGGEGVGRTSFPKAPNTSIAHFMTGTVRNCFATWIYIIFVNYILYHKSKLSNTTLGPKFLWKSKSFTKPTFSTRTAISGRLSTSSGQGASDADLKTLKTETLKT